MRIFKTKNGWSAFNTGSYHQGLTVVFPVKMISTKVSIEKSPFVRLFRRAWCMNGKGELLLFSVSPLVAALRRPPGGGEDSEGSSLDPFRGELEGAVERCFYCLYLHPPISKRARLPRYLEDHNVTQVSVAR